MPGTGQPSTAESSRLQPENHLPWSQSQVSVIGSWPTRRDQPVSVAMSPVGGLLALSVGQRLSVCALSERMLSEPLVQAPCALAPCLVWSPDGDKLAFRDDEGHGRILDLSRADHPATVMPPGEPKPASAMAFAPDGQRLAILAPSLPGRMTLTLFGAAGEFIWESMLTRDRQASYRSEGVSLAWAPGGQALACATGTSAIWLIDAADGHATEQDQAHSRVITGLAWVDDDQIVSASEDATLRLWRPDAAVAPVVVETIPAAGMTYVRERNIALIWSTEGELFAWSLADSPTQLWCRVSPSRSVAAHFTRLAISAAGGLLAVVDPGATELLLVSGWERTPATPAMTTTYSNAKVLLLGDSGVGKSALAMVLAGEDFRPTESTHGRRIWRLPASDEVGLPRADREILVWDLAGQPGYRIVHQLHLAGSAAALIVFDSRSETTPLAGVRHWARAVRHAHPVTDGGPVTFLVAARTDRGGISVSPERRQQVMSDFALDDYFETSAREGAGISELRSRLLAAIDWEKISKVASTALFVAMKSFVVEQKSTGNLMTPLDELCADFHRIAPSSLQMLDAGGGAPDSVGNGGPQAAEAGLGAVFEGCVERLESAGLVKRLKYWDYVLLQPELLDSYASAIVNAARDEPDGLGSILESRVIDLDFPVPSADRIPGERQERLLVLATLEELIQCELVMREDTPAGVQLVFPSAYRRDLPVSEAPAGDGVVFRLEGPIDNIYASLIVRLARSNRFSWVAAWQSAARFSADRGICTISLKSDGEGKGELWVAYDGVSDSLRTQFERFVHLHLEARASSGTVVRERQYSCPNDKTAFTPEQVMQVRNLHRRKILCPVCEKHVSLHDDYELISSADNSTAAMNASADAERDREAATAVVRGKEEVAEFDVFLCHNWQDKPAVRDLAQRLRDRGLRPWLDEDELRPGLPWQRDVEAQIQDIPAAIVVVGSGIGPWQNQELEAFLRQFIKRNCPVIPVLLPDVDPPKLPVFLDGMTYVDLGFIERDPLEKIEWGITGRHPSR